MNSTTASEGVAPAFFPEKYRTGAWVILASIMMLSTVYLDVTCPNAK